MEGNTENVKAGNSVNAFKKQYNDWKKMSENNNNEEGQE